MIKSILMTWRMFTIGRAVRRQNSAEIKGRGAMKGQLVLKEPTASELLDDMARIMCTGVDVPQAMIQKYVAARSTELLAMDEVGQREALYRTKMLHLVDLNIFGEASPVNNIMDADDATVH